MRKIASSFLVVFSVLSCRNSPNEPSIVYKKLQGTWMKNCNAGSSHVMIEGSSLEAVILVVSNQIVIDAKIDSTDFSKNKALYLRYSNTEDLGAGGATLNWAHFSKDSVIASMVFKDTSHAIIKWYGFYDNQMKKRIWQNKLGILTDYNIAGNETEVVNCDYTAK